MCTDTKFVCFSARIYIECLIFLLASLLISPWLGCLLKKTPNWAILTHRMSLETLSQHSSSFYYYVYYYYGMSHTTTIAPMWRKGSQAMRGAFLVTPCIILRIIMRKEKWKRHTSTLNDSTYVREHRYKNSKFVQRLKWFQSRNLIHTTVILF